VACLRRATSLAYTDADEDAERLLSFGDTSNSGKAEDEWVETHAGRQPSNDSAANPGVIDDIPDLDGAAQEENGLVDGMGNMSLSGAKDTDTPDLDDIPDMEEDLEDGEDEAAAVPEPVAPVSAVAQTGYAPKFFVAVVVKLTTDSAGSASEIQAANGNLLQVRTYDVMITYDKYYQTPRIWLIGYDEVCALSVQMASFHCLRATSESGDSDSAPNIPRRLCGPCQQDRYNRSVPSLFIAASCVCASLQTRECHEKGHRTDECWRC